MNRLKGLPLAGAAIVCVAYLLAIEVIQALFAGTSVDAIGLTTLSDGLFIGIAILMFATGVVPKLMPCHKASAHDEEMSAIASDVREVEGALHVAPVRKTRISGALHSATVVIACVAWVLIAWFIGAVASSALVTYVEDPSFAAYSDTFGTSDAMASAILAVVVAPVAEELLFRRGLFAGFVGAGVPWVASALVSAVTFAVTHGTLIHLPMAFLTGMALCAVYAWTGKIWVSMVAHGAMNGVALLLTGLSLPGFLLGFGLVIVIVAYIVSLVGSAVMLDIVGDHRLDG